MSRFASQETKRIDIGNGEWIDVKKSLSFEEVEDVDFKAFAADAGGANNKQLSALLGACIVDWNLCDETGKKVAVTKNNVKKLKFTEALSLAPKIFEALDFTGGAGGVASSESPSEIITKQEQLPQSTEENMRTT